MKRVLGISAAVAFLVAVLAACGDDRPSREALTQRVAEICASAGERHEEAAAGFDFATFDPTTSDLTEVVPLIEQNVAIGKETATELDKVRGPKADEATIDRWIAVNDAIAVNASELIVAAREGDRDEFMALAGAEEELHAEFPDNSIFEGC